MTCAHWWMIVTPDGPTSWGECRHCYETKEFSNTMVVDPDWKAAGVRGAAAKKAQADLVKARREFDADRIGLVENRES